MSPQAHRGSAVSLYSALHWKSHPTEPFFHGSWWKSPRAFGVVVGPFTLSPHFKGASRVAGLSPPTTIWHFLRKQNAEIRKEKPGPNNFRRTNWIQEFSCCAFVNAYCNRNIHIYLYIKIHCQYSLAYSWIHTCIVLSSMKLQQFHPISNHLRHTKRGSEKN